MILPYKHIDEARYPHIQRDACKCAKKAESIQGGYAVALVGSAASHLVMSFLGHAISSVKTVRQ